MARPQLRQGAGVDLASQSMAGLLPGVRPNLGPQTPAYQQQQLPASFQMGQAGVPAGYVLQNTNTALLQHLQQTPGGYSAILETGTGKVSGGRDSVPLHVPGLPMVSGRDSVPLAPGHAPPSVQAGRDSVPGRESVQVNTGLLSADYIIIRAFHWLIISDF